MLVTHAVVNMSLVFVAGMLKESQQWQVYTEGPAGGPDAESPQVPPTSSGREVRLHSFKVRVRSGFKVYQCISEISPPWRDKGVLITENPWGLFHKSSIKISGIIE